ncbi:hypothetical protein [Acinetobacter sp.]|uniref:hypothetical protein n=1 Tax=Acinetobacter sp. TaxID=472 RepID=UPI002FD9B0C1
MTSILDHTFWKRTFIVYRKIAFLALKQREIQWTRPFLFKCLEEYQAELRVLLENFLDQHYKKRQIDQQYATELTEKIFKEGYFLEEVMSYIQSGELKTTNNWEIEYLVPITEVEKYIQSPAYQLYCNKLKNYYQTFRDIEGDHQDIIKNFYLCNILYNIDINDLFCRCLILNLYDKKIKKIEVDNEFEIPEIIYPTFLFRNITRHRVKESQQTTATELQSRQLNLTAELHEHADNLLPALSEYLFEFFKIHFDLKKTVFKDKLEQIGEADNIVDVLWFIESKIGNQTGLTRPDNLFSIVLTLISCDETIQQIKTEVEQILEKDKRLYVLGVEESKYQIRSYSVRIDTYDSNIKHISGKKFFNQLKEKKIRRTLEFNDLMLKLEDAVKELQNIETKIENGEQIEFFLLQGKHVLISKSLTKDAFKKAVNRGIKINAKWMSNVLKI